jgi:phosphate starvation-inducible protein PhoH and related proteins
LRETIIQVDSANPVEIFGVNNQHVQVIQAFFPKLKIIVRGNILKAMGTEQELVLFERKMYELLDYYNRYSEITTSAIESIFNSKNSKEEFQPIDKVDDAIVFGPNGLVVRAKTINQKKMVESIEKNDMLFAVGPAGTGKTYTAVALAVKAYKNKEVRRIILTRPAVEAGEHLGFLPGDLKEKLDPYLQPLYDALRDMLPAEKLKEMMEGGIIQIAPLAFMRGRTLDKAFVILDEAQNATESQLKMFLTRMGKSAKFIITGDVTQIDLPKSQPSGLVQALKILKNVAGIDIIMLNEKDAVRHQLVKKIINQYSKIDKTKSSEKSHN